MVQEKPLHCRHLQVFFQQKEGSVVFEGKDITRVPAHKIVEMGIAHVPEGRRVFSDLSVYENPIMGAYTRKKIKLRSRKALQESIKGFRDWKSVKDSVPAHFLVVSSRCLPWGVPL